MEIKILCPCGAKYKFDVEPVNGRSPGPVHCPSCGKDGTEAANTIIREKLAPPSKPAVPEIPAIPASPSVASVSSQATPAKPVVATPIASTAQPQPKISVSIPAAPLTSQPPTNAPIAATPESSKVSISAIRIPATPATPTPAPVQVSVPVPAAPVVAATPPPASAPEAPKPSVPLGPKITVMPVPERTKALSVKPPGEATVHEMPEPSAAPSNASGDPKNPGSPKMAYMPVPETIKALSVKPPGEATEHEAAPASSPAPSSSEPKAAGSPKMAYMPVPESTKALSVKPPGEATVYEESASSSAPSNAAGDPKAAGSPKMAYMPVPESTKSLSVKPPGEATVHEALPPKVSSNAAGDPKAPGSPKMAFMPAPASGSGSALSVSGGHGKKEEKPAEPAQAAQTVSEPARAHPAAAKMAAPPQPFSSSSKLSAGITGAVIGCLIGAAIWYFVALNVGGWRILAWIPGIVGGFGAVLLAKKPSEKLGRAAAVVAAIITILTQFAVIAGINDQRLTDASETSFRIRMALAKKAAEVKTDDQVRKLIDEDPDYDGLKAGSLREVLEQAIDKVKKAQEEEANKAAGKEPGDAERIAEYRQKRLPELIKFSQGDPSRSRFIEKERARLEEEGDVLYRKKYISMGIWIFSSIEAAFLIGRGKKKE